MYSFNFCYLFISDGYHFLISNILIFIKIVLFVKCLSILFLVIFLIHFSTNLFFLLLFTFKLFPFLFIFVVLK